MRDTVARGLTVRARILDEIGDAEQELAIRRVLVARYRTDESLRAPVAISLSEAARILRAGGNVERRWARLESSLGLPAKTLMSPFHGSRSRLGSTPRRTCEVLAASVKPWRSWIRSSPSAPANGRVAWASTPVQTAWVLRLAMLGAAVVVCGDRFDVRARL